MPIIIIKVINRDILKERVTAVNCNFLQNQRKIPLFHA